jgi:hypothetical protein
MVHDRETETVLDAVDALLSRWDEGYAPTEPLNRLRVARRQQKEHYAYEEYRARRSAAEDDLDRRIVDEQPIAAVRSMTVETVVDLLVARMSGKTDMSGLRQYAAVAVGCAEAVADAPLRAPTSAEQEAAVVLHRLADALGSGTAWSEFADDLRNRSLTWLWGIPPTVPSARTGASDE